MTTETHDNRVLNRTILIIAAGGMVLWFSIGTRQSFGLFLPILSADLGWGREVFAFALALQNLIWGVTQPIAGVIADRYGAARVIAVGGFFYAAGVLFMAYADTPILMQGVSALLIGIGLSGAGFTVVLAAVGRIVPEHRRGFAFGIVSATGSVGQFAMIPLAQISISAWGWNSAFILLAAFVLLIIPISFGLKTPPAKPSPVPETKISAGSALREAWRHPGYRLLLAGFFVCGFQVMFVAAHLPAFLGDAGLSAALAATALTVLGFFNIFGSLGLGILGDHFSKKWLLSILYAARAVLIIVFISFPITPLSAILFSAAIGFLWLGTVPLTSGIVAGIFGVRHLGLLFGVIFLGHQVGAFLGVWLGGLIFDATGSYTPVWWIAIGLGVLAAILHLPISEESLAKPAPVPSVS